MRYLGKLAYSATALAVSAFAPEIAKAQADDFDVLLGDAVPLNDDELREQRGGFSISGNAALSGYDVHFGVDITTLVETVDAATGFTTEANANPGGFAAEAAFNLPAGANLGSVEINNTLDNVRIVQDIVVNASIPNFDHITAFRSAGLSVSHVMTDASFLGGLF